MLGGDGCGCWEPWAEEVIGACPERAWSSCCLSLEISSSYLIPRKTNQKNALRIESKQIMLHTAAWLPFAFSPYQIGSAEMRSFLGSEHWLSRRENLSAIWAERLESLDKPLTFMLEIVTLRFANHGFLSKLIKFASNSLQELNNAALCGRYHWAVIIHRHVGWLARKVLVLQDCYNSS